MAVPTPNQVNTMQLQSILNRVQRHPGFVYDRARFVERGGRARIVVAIRERRGCRPVCSGCGDTVTLKHTRWVLLKRKENLSGNKFCRLTELMRANTNTLRGYLLKEQFQEFWGHKSSTWADKFLDHWLRQAEATKLEPFRRLAKTLRDHRSLLLNWFRAREEFAADAVEGFNLKARVTTRLAYGFRSYDHAEIALYHRLGNLPEPAWLTHKFT